VGQLGTSDVGELPTGTKDNDMKKNRIAAAAILGALSFGVGAPAFAQATSTVPVTSTATTATSTAATPSAATPASRKAEHEARRDAQIADLAARLGITKEKVVAANTAMQASKPARSANGTRPTAAERKANATARFAAYASALGVSVDALTKAVTDQQKAQLDARVADGSLTAAQAAARKSVVDADSAAGDLRGIGGRGGRGGHGRGGHGGGHR
jgi:hypothetical protein